MKGDAMSTEDEDLREAEVTLGMDLSEIVADREVLTGTTFSFGGRVEFLRFYREITEPPHKPAWKAMSASQLLTLSEKAESYLMAHESQVLFNCAVEREEQENRLLLTLARAPKGRPLPAGARDAEGRNVT